MKLKNEIKLEALRDLRSKRVHSLLAYINSMNIGIEKIDEFIKQVKECKEFINEIECELTKIDTEWDKEKQFNSDDVPF